MWLLGKISRDIGKEQERERETLRGMGPERLV